MMSPAEPTSGLKRAQFSLGGLLLLMLVLGVTCAAAHYVLRGGPGAEGTQLSGLVLLLAAPLLLLVAVSMAALLWRLRRRG